MLSRLTPERWRQIRSIAGQVLDAAPEHRESTLSRECGTDRELRLATEQILSQYSETDDLLGNQPYRPVAREQRELTPGDLVGAYRIERELGKGSMGRVYLAHRADDAFSKTVAIKLIRFSGQAPEDRFRAERRILASLEHAHIARLHDAGSCPHGLYLVMEYVQGQPLDVYCRSARLSLPQRLRLFVLVCEAVAYAHRQGVRHSDLKPQNILVDASGHPKLLDFGIAAFDGEISQGYTPRYASPEQRRGEPAHDRADIYSLGAVLRELLENNSPPADLAAILAKAQAAHPAARYSSAHHLAADLENFLAHRPPTAYPGSWVYRARKLVRRQPQLTVALMFTALAAGAFWFTRPEAPPSTAHVERLSSLNGREAYPAISPDGRAVAFASRVNGNWDIYTQQQPEQPPLNVTAGTLADDTQPAFSPDGRQLAFRSERDGGGIFVMDLPRGTVRKLSPFGFHPAWSPDGRQIAFSTVAFLRMRATVFLRRGQLWAVNLSSGPPRRLISGTGLADGTQPVWSPSGTRIAFWGVDRQGTTSIYTVEVDSAPHPPTLLVRGGPPKSASGRVWSPFWSVSGRYLYYNSDSGGTSTLWRAPIDESRGTLRGQPVRLPLPVSDAGAFSLSRDGKRLAYTVDTESWNIEKLGFDPALLQTIGEPVAVTTGQNGFERPRVSPDGRQLVFESILKENIWTSATDGTGLRPVALGPPQGEAEKATFPRFIDQSTIGFLSQTDQGFQAVTVRLDGNQRLAWTPRSKNSVGSLKWFTPQRLLVADTFLGRFYFQEPGRSPEPLPIPVPPAHTFSFSPSARGQQHLLGRLIPLERRQDAQAALYHLATRQLTRLGVVVDDAIELFAEERLLLYKDHSHVLRLLDRRTGQTRELYRFGPDELIGMDLSPDQRWLYFGRSRASADVWVADMTSPL